MSIIMMCPNRLKLMLVLAYHGVSVWTSTSLTYHNACVGAGHQYATPCRNCRARVRVGDSRVEQADAEELPEGIAGGEDVASRGGPKRGGGHPFLSAPETWVAPLVCYKLLENSFVVPDAALADVPAALRAPAEPTLGAAGSAGNGSAPRGRS